MQPKLEAIAPERVKRLPVDESRGYPVPWFVKWIDGKPEFRVADAAKYAQAVRQKLCWICGEPLGRRVFFVIGPMCTINRISADPPSHRDCAVFSVKACPFLSKPQMERRVEGLPENARGEYFGGVGLEHNPGLTVLYMPMDYEHARAPGGFLFHLGQPLELTWWTLGRLATADEAAAGFKVGAERLRGLVKTERPEELKEFERCFRRAWDFLPSALSCPANLVGKLGGNG